MKRYKIQVGAFVTRICTRQIIVRADNEEEACEKAKAKYEILEKRRIDAQDTGDLQIDFIEEL